MSKIKKSYGNKKDKSNHAVNMTPDLSNEMIAFIKYFNYSSVSDYIRQAVREFNIKKRAEYRKQYMFDKGNPDQSLHNLVMGNVKKMEDIEDMVNDIVDTLNDRTSNDDSVPKGFNKDFLKQQKDLEIDDSDEEFDAEEINMDE